MGRGRAIDGAAGHVLADDVWLAVVLADVVDGDDVGVAAELAHGLRLALNAGEAGVVEALGLNDGHGDLAVEALVVGEVDALASAFAEEVFHVVAAARERIGQWRGRGGGRRRLAWRRSLQRLAAGVAELGFGADLGGAVGALGRERAAALVAERGAVAVLVVTRWTKHERGLVYNSS
jgi:hypothetical protein